jgi:prepilin-type N-terminal cleavage/methylation domain-containing protein
VNARRFTGGGRAARRGFSLLELLVAIGLLAVLVGAVYAFITTLFARETRALDEAARSQTAVMVFDRLESDLMSAVATGAEGSVGLTGSSETLTVAHRSVVPGSASAPWSDAQSTTIRFDARRQRITIERTDGGEAFGGGARGDEPMPFPVPIRAARFRYHDGDGWRDGFESSRALPAAVELAIWFGDPEDDPGADDPSVDPFSEFGPGPGTAGPGGAIGGISGGRPGEAFDPNRLGAEELARLTGAFGGESSAGGAFAGEDLDEDLGQPDRVRLITIPDARVPRAIRRAGEIGGTP